MSVSRRLLRALDDRDGHQCCWHHPGQCDPETLVPQHRVNRGMGGRPSLDRLSNLVWLDAWTNGLIESNAAYAEIARKCGVKLRDVEPSDEPIEHSVHGLVLLDDEGGVTSWAPEADPDWWHDMRAEGENW